MDGRIVQRIGLGVFIAGSAVYAWTWMKIQAEEIESQNRRLDALGEATASGVGRLAKAVLVNDDCLKAQGETIDRILDHLKIPVNEDDNGR